MKKSFNKRAHFCLDLSHYGAAAKTPMKKSQCRLCRNAQVREYKKKNPDKIKEYKEKYINRPEYVRAMAKNLRDAPDEFVNTKLVLLQFKRMIRQVTKQAKANEPKQLEQEV